MSDNLGDIPTIEKDAWWWFTTPFDERLEEMKELFPNNKLYMFSMPMRRVDGAEGETIIARGCFGDVVINLANCGNVEYECWIVNRETGERKKQHP